jgi:hypothetical protein
MELLGGGRLPKKLTSEGKHSRVLFDKKGNLRRIPNLDPWPLHRVLSEKYGVSYNLCVLCVHVR